MAVGRVKYFSEVKGFGYIDDGTGTDVYVHHTAVETGQALPEGAVVTYDLIVTSRGPEAANVRIHELF